VLAFRTISFFQTFNFFLQIYFPTGTKVDISMSIGYMNVDIKPSAHDLSQTRGLCGYFSGTCRDDFRLRDNSQSTVAGTQEECAGQYYPQLNPTDFSNSWKYVCYLNHNNI
jgi:hypothetical protein